MLLVRERDELSSGKLGWPVLKCTLLIFARSASVLKQSQFKWWCQLSVQVKVPLQPPEEESTPCSMDMREAGELIQALARVGDIDEWGPARSSGARVWLRTLVSSHAA